MILLRYTFSAAQLQIPILHNRFQSWHLNLPVPSIFSIPISRSQRTSSSNSAAGKRSASPTCRRRRLATGVRLWCLAGSASRPPVVDDRVRIGWGGPRFRTAAANLFRTTPPSRRGNCTGVPATNHSLTHCWLSRNGYVHVEKEKKKLVNWQRRTLLRDRISLNAFPMCK